MRILALDTTTDISSIAVADDRGLLGEYNFAHRMDLSRRLMPNIVALLKDCGMQMKDVEAVGVSVGPGSFTGLRMGVVTAKTMAQALDIQIAGITSLDLLAHTFDYLPDTLVCPLVKVRKGEAYFAFFRAAQGVLERLSDYQAETIEQVIEQAKGFGSHKIIFCGDAVNANVPALCQALGDRVIAAPDWLSFPKASVLARLAMEKIAEGQADDYLTLVPFYIRRSTPEIRMEEGRVPGV
jgi:tRNA threonylcarbamoyladenosine biosynthesis protein TsaB